MWGLMLGSMWRSTLPHGTTIGTKPAAVHEHLRVVTLYLIVGCPPMVDPWDINGMIARDRQNNQVPRCKNGILSTMTYSPESGGINVCVYVCAIRRPNGPSNNVRYPLPCEHSNTDPGYRSLYADLTWICVKDTHIKTGITISSNMQLR